MGDGVCARSQGTHGRDEDGGGAPRSSNPKGDVAVLQHLPSVTLDFVPHSSFQERHGPCSPCVESGPVGAEGSGHRGGSGLARGGAGLTLRFGPAPGAERVSQWAGEALSPGCQLASRFLPTPSGLRHRRALPLPRGREHHVHTQCPRPHSASLTGTLVIHTDKTLGGPGWPGTGQQRAPRTLDRNHGG